jgi:hypothetical protein
MTRRNLLSAKIAGFFAAGLRGRAAAPALSAAAASSTPLPRAKWIENGIIDAGGSHEPYSFVVRRGGQRLDARQDYERNQSEETIVRLKEQGIEVFHTHFYKGAGMAHERPEMEDAKRVAAIAHKHGLKVDSYLQWNTMIYEPFFVEEPRAQNWIQRDAAGQPIMLTYGYQQSYRYRPCFSNQEYLDYLKKIVRYAVEEVKTDFIHFDNYDLNPEPESCHCEWCVKGFRAFLRRKYTAAQRRERFGFENTDYVNPPRWNRPHPPDRMEIIFDPAIQEWIDYRCQSMTDALAQMATLIKSLNPEVVVEVNPHGITGGNRAWQAGLDHARFLKYTEVFWTEERNTPAVHPDGRITSTIRSYKLARAFKNILFTYTSLDEAAIAECLTFNQTLGAVGGNPREDMRRYIRFYKANRELYSGSVDAGNVALLRSYPSITYHAARAQLSAILVEQALIQSKIPFDLVFDEHLADLSKYRALILPESQCLSDEQLGYIRKFVENGGGLVATGMAGLYDHWRRLRVEPGLKGLIDGQRPARGYQERVEREEEGGTAVRKQAGKGRAIYFPTVQFDGPLPEMEPYFTISSRRFWKAPKNWKEIAEGVRWAAGTVPLEVSGPDYLIANLTAHPSKRRTVVHLVNYNHRNVPAIESVAVTCRLPEGARFQNATALSPDFEGSQPVAVKSEGGAVSFTLPRVKIYSVVVLNW